MTARTDAQALHERKPATVLEVDLDYCTNTMGVAPCTAGRVDSGTAQAGGASSITLRAGASAADDAYNNMVVHIVSGTGAGQERVILDYVGATKIATVAAWTTPPNATSVYNVIDRPNGCYNVFAGDVPCKDKANFTKGVKTIKFCERGMLIPGEQIRPYIVDQNITATEIDPVKCLSARSQTSFTLLDEPCRDDLDKYVDNRAAAAGGTFFTRLMARNPNIIGRFARARRGYVVTPWDWNTFQTELYTVEVLKGPNDGGKMQLVVSDAMKLLDRTMLPVATSGKLPVALSDIFTTDFLQGGGASTATLATGASAVDDAYNGMEIAIVGGLGFGQKRIVLDYTGSTRLVTTTLAWDIVPNATSIYEISELSLNVGSGKGGEYADPAVTLRQEFVCIGDEVIRYTAKVGDVLSWPDSTYRAQFDTELEEHRVDSGVQQCLAFINDPATYVVQNIINRGGIADTYIDTAKLAEVETQWFGTKAYTTACITHPEKSSDLLEDYLVDINLMTWWHPVNQKVQFEVNAPVLGSVASYTDDTLIKGTSVEKLDKDRLTRAAVYYDLLSATADEGKPSNFRTVTLYIDTEAEDPRGYNDVRADLRKSRWMKTANAVLVAGVVGRRLLSRSAAPVKLKLELDPRTEPVLGSLVDITTRKVVGADGRAKTLRYRVVKVEDEGGLFSVQARSTSFNRRYGFICPNGYPDYAVASEAQRERAFIAANTALMSDGTGAYLII